MTYLIDTHAFLWFIKGDKRLSRRARRCITVPKNRRLVSVVSLWEICVKHSLGKLTLSKNQALEPFLKRQLAGNAFEMLPVSAEHAFETANLPWHHRDPFDRLLIGVAIRENLPVVTADQNFSQYAIETTW